MTAPSKSASTAAAVPRLCAVFLGAARSSAQIVAAIGRVPRELAARVTEITVLLDAEDASVVADELEALGRELPNLRVHRDPRRHGHGGRRKIAFEYALQHGFDHVVVLEPDERFVPERLGELWDVAVRDGAGMVIGARASSLGSRALDALLGLQVHDYASPFRMIACAVLQRIPFLLNSDDRAFDVELLIQCRALGVVVREVRVESSADASWSSARALSIALGYRAHQLHLTRNGRYFVDHDVHYSLKHHPSSSHMQVLDALRPGSLALDLGCSQGLLAAPLVAKGVRVVGVDMRAPSTVSSALERYYQRDLEQPLELPEQRVFDYVVCSDVIEHVLHREELLRSVRRYLKPDGRLLISTPNIAIWFYRLSLLVGRFEYGPRGVLDHTHVHLYTRATFRREIENAGFRIVRERATALPFEIAFESTGRSGTVRALASAYHIVARAWPSLFAYQFLLEAEARTVLDDAARAS